MLGKLLLLSGLVCLTTAAQQPISRQKTQIYSLNKENDAAQVPASLSSSGCELNSTRANPKNLLTYFHCTANGLALMRCPDNMIFESASTSCIKGKTPAHGTKVPECPTNSAEATYFPTPDCLGFYLCSNGIPYQFDCQTGLFWNQGELQCDYTPDCPDIVSGGWSKA